MKLLKLIGNFFLSLLLAIFLMIEAGFVSCGFGLAAAWCLVYFIVTIPLHALGFQLTNAQDLWAATGVFYFLFWLIALVVMYEHKKEEALSAA